MACGGAVEHSKIGVDDSVFIASNESALRYPQTGVHLLCQNRSHQKTSESCPPAHLLAAMLHWRNRLSALAARFRSLNRVGNLVA